MVSENEKTGTSCSLNVIIMQEIKWDIQKVCPRWPKNSSHYTPYLRSGTGNDPALPWTEPLFGGFMGYIVACHKYNPILNTFSTCHSHALWSKYIIYSSSQIFFQNIIDSNDWFIYSRAVEVCVIGKVVLGDTDATLQWITVTLVPTGLQSRVAKQSWGTKTHWSHWRKAMMALCQSSCWLLVERGPSVQAELHI